MKGTVHLKEYLASRILTVQSFQDGLTEMIEYPAL
jgi:hypothetical protein